MGKSFDKLRGSALLFLGLCTLPFTATAQYDVVLAGPSTFDIVRSQGLNDGGQIVGQLDNPGAANNDLGFVYNPDTNTLETLETSEGIVESVNGISANGTIVGRYRRQLNDDNQNYNDCFVRRPGIDGEGHRVLSTFFDISDLLSTNDRYGVGYVQIPFAGGGVHSFRAAYVDHTEANPQFRLLPQELVYKGSKALAISSLNNLITGTRKADGTNGEYPFLCRYDDPDSPDCPVIYEDAPRTSFGQSVSRAIPAAINGSGIITGVMRLASGAPVDRPFRLNALNGPDPALETIDFLPGYVDRTHVVTDINEEGSILGSVSIAGDNVAHFIVEPGAQTPSELPSQIADVRIDRVTSINNCGVIGADLVQIVPGQNPRYTGYLVPQNPMAGCSQGSCQGDLNADRSVDFHDLNMLLDSWGMGVSVPCSLGDVNCSGQVDFSDLNILLDNWGNECV